MKKGHNFLEHVMAHTALDPELIPGHPIVEIVSDRRVLVENHQGVAAFGRERILVNVPFGSVSICGCNLDMIHMTKEQLVICGKIKSIGLQRRI